MNQVFVFGAGASTASADTPLGRDLVWNYHLDCGLLVPINNGVPDLSEENENFKNFRKFIELCSTIYPEFKNLTKKWDGRGEEIFYLYDRIEKKHYVDELLEILQRNSNKLGIELVRKLIFEHLVESSIGSQNLLYKKFITEILKNGSKRIGSIISFNFDFLLHDFKNDVCFDYLLKFDWIDSSRQSIYAQTNPIKLIKLNGSLDWGICPSCNRLYLYYPHMFRHSYNDKTCSLKCGKPIQPFIVIPHEKYKSIIEPLWTLAERELRHANIVTVIGYSFPEYDKKVIDLFSKSLGPHTKLEVVNHCQPNEDKGRKKNTILMKYKKLFPSLEIDVYLDGFEGYIDSYTS